MIGTTAAIRLLGVADIPAMLLIERDGHSHPWTEGVFADCFKSGYENYGLDEEGRLNGFMVLQRVVDEIHLLNLCVSKSSRRKGYASQMLAHLVRLASDSSSVEVFLEVRASNRAARQLYESRGFNEIGVRRNYYPGVAGREDAVMMVLSLHE